MLKYNKNMINCLKSIVTFHQNFLDKIMRLWPGFIEIKGFVLLRKYDETREQLEEIDVDKALSVYYDRTGFEASYNEFRIEDYFDRSIDNPLEGIAIAIKLSEIWELKLKKDFPHYMFHIIIGFDGEYTTIRFHKLRDEESTWIDLDDLDSYKKEAIAVRIIE